MLNVLFFWPVRSQQLPIFDSYSKSQMMPFLSSPTLCPTRLQVVGIAVLLLFFRCSEVLAQVDSSGSEKTDFRYTVHYTSDSGLTSLVPEKWGTLRMSLVNGRSNPRDVLCSTYFDQDSSLQYGRQVWIPAQSLLRIDHPIFVPKCDPNKGRNVGIHSLVFDRSSGSETLLRSDGGVLRHDGALIVTHETRNTALIGDPSLNVDLRQDEIANLIVACRVKLGLSNTFTALKEAFLPADETSLDTLDHIVLADDRLIHDLAATTAIRRWLHAGGHLWIMLDRVSPQVVEMLLGDGFTGSVVDRVSLTSIRVDTAPDASNPDGKVGETLEYDQPVELVRLLTSDTNVTHLVNGWPAAMSVPFGDGKLLITTLGARAWFKPTPKGAQNSIDPMKTSNYMPTLPMVSVADEFFRLREPQLLKATSVEPQVNEYIGYSVLSWWLIVGTLLGFSVAVVVIGLLLLRFGCLERLLWMGSAVAIMVSLFLIQAGRTNRQAISPTLASVQLIQAIPGTDDYRSDGFLSTYQPEGSEAPIEVTHGGRMVPDMTGLEQTSRRMVTVDLGVNRWDNVHQSAGVHSTSFEQAQSVSDRMVAYVTFDSQGVSGKYAGLVSPGTDAMLATRAGRLGLTLNSDGTFVGRADDVFEKDQYLGAGLLSDEQDRRRRTLKELLDNPKRTDYPNLPQLLFWGQPWDNGFRFGQGLKNQGASLVAVPLVFERPADGTEFVIPSPLLSYENRRNPDGTQSSAMWNAARREWQERSAAGVAWLNVQVPPELTPLAATRARIDMKVTGPIGRVEILGLKGTEVVSLKEVANPVGSISIDISDVDALVVDDDGHLVLGVNAGVPQAENGASNTSKTTKANYWRIESLAIQLWARTAEPTAKE